MKSYSCIKTTLLVFIQAKFPLNLKTSGGSDVRLTQEKILLKVAFFFFKQRTQYINYMLMTALQICVFFTHLYCMKNHWV